MANHKPNTKGLKKFKPGADSRRNMKGRPVKFYTTMKQEGYSASQVTDCIAAMLGYTRKQLQQVAKNADATILERGIAKLLIEFAKTGRPWDLDTIFQRAWGAPKQTLESTTTIKVSINKSKPDGHKH